MLFARRPRSRPNGRGAPGADEAGGARGGRKTAASVLHSMRKRRSGPLTEKHFTASETVRDIVISMSDGLTVPFALAAGLSGAVEATAIIITAGLAEVEAGAIAMGLGGYES